MTLIRKTRAADRNLPTFVGPHRLTVTIHREGPLAGSTTVEGDARALRTFDNTWTEHIAAVEAPEPEPEVDLDAWAADLVSGTVSALEEALDTLDPEEHTTAHVEALVAAESAGKDRSSAIEAINAWGDDVPAE